MTKARDLGDNAQNTKPKVVNAKADLIVGTGSDAADRLAVGSNGDTLVADSSTSTGLRWVKTSPNYAVNGAFDYWQRGTSFTVGASNTYTADRFYCYAAGANATIARSTSVPTGSIAPYSLEFTGAASQTLLEIGQKIESQYINALKTTVTFSAKVYNNTGAAFTPTIYIQNPTAADNWSGVTVAVSNVALQSCADGAWTTIYYTADWSGYSNISNGASVIIEFGAAANGASKKIRITEWQVTPTAMIIPFQRSSATLAGEYAAAQRYYCKSYDLGTAPGTANTNNGLVTFSNTSYINGQLVGHVAFPVSMRTAPTVTTYAYNGTDTSQISQNSNGASLGTNSGQPIFIGQNGFTVQQNTGGTVTANGGALCHFIASAEL